VDYLVSCNHLVKIVKVYMLPFCGEIKMNIILEKSEAVGGQR